MIFFRLEKASITNTIAATTSRTLIKFPPMLRSIPINQNKTTKPPNQRKKVTESPPCI
jgi:hypothetical protein